MDDSGVDPATPPSGDGCVECEGAGGWCIHLRRCAACGHVGCCDSSPGQHASAHFRASGHPVVQTFEPGEAWFWDYGSEAFADGPRLADPQTSPGPAERVPDDWRDRLHA